ncbi:MAG: dTMP kinase [Alphaproteobacteria bacterium]
MTRGRFITLEGGEGAGKSTQARLLAERLAAAGLKTHVTREVGGSPSAEDIRKLWLADRDEEWDALTELLLIFAARREHLTKTIWPKLDAGTWVISDRFVGSTIVYQGIVMGLGRDKVETLYRMVAEDFQSDLTLLLDVPVAAARERISARNLDRYERQPDEFHEKLRQGYLRLAAENPAAWRVIDASQPAENVSEQIWRAASP